MKQFIALIFCLFTGVIYSQTSPSTIYVKGNKKMVGTVKTISKSKVTVIPPGGNAEVDLPVDKVDSIKTSNGSGKDSAKVSLKFDATDSTALNDIFRVNFFSDLVGLSSDKPNGLLQTEIVGNWNFFRDRSMKNDGELHIPHRIYLLKNVNISVTVSKIDSKLRTIPLNYNPTDSMPHIHIFDMVQYSNLGLTGKLNVLTYETRSRDTVKSAPYIRCRFFADGILQGFRTTVVDTLFKRDKQYDLFSYGLGVQFKFRVEHYTKQAYKGPRVGLEFGCTYFWMHVTGNSEDFAIRYGPIYTRDLARNNDYDSTYTAKNNLIFHPRLTAFYERSDRQRIYFTAALLNNYYQTNRFFQIQIGYSQAFGPKQIGAIFKP